MRLVGPSATPGSFATRVTVTLSEAPEVGTRLVWVDELWDDGAAAMPGR